jgi:hypothetical protein
VAERETGKSATVHVGHFVHLPVMRVCGLVSLLKGCQDSYSLLEECWVFRTSFITPGWRILMLMSNLEMECGWSGEMP